MCCPGLWPGNPYSDLVWLHFKDGLPLQKENVPLGYHLRPSHPSIESPVFAGLGKLGQAASLVAWTEGLSFRPGRFQKAVHCYPFSCEVRNQAEGLVFYWSHLETSVSNQVVPFSHFKDGSLFWRLPVPHAGFRLRDKYLNK